MGSRQGRGAGRDGEPGLCEPHIPTNSGSVRVGGRCCPTQVRMFHSGEQVRKEELERSGFSSQTVNASKESS